MRRSPPFKKNTFTPTPVRAGPQFETEKPSPSHRLHQERIAGTSWKVDDVLHVEFLLLLLLCGSIGRKWGEKRVGRKLAVFWFRDLEGWKGTSRHSITPFWTPQPPNPSLQPREISLRRHQLTTRGRHIFAFLLVAFITQTTSKPIDGWRTDNSGLLTGPLQLSPSRKLPLFLLVQVEILARRRCPLLNT